MVGLTEFIWNLRQLVRNGFPKGLPIDTLELNYGHYFPHHHVPTPDSINCNCQDWSDVFKKSDRFQEWFYINSQASIMMWDKPEPDLHGYFRLNNHDHYILVRQRAKYEQWEISETEDESVSGISDDEVFLNSIISNSSELLVSCGHSHSHADNSKEIEHRNLPKKLKCSSKKSKCASKQANQVVKASCEADAVNERQRVSCARVLKTESESMDDYGNGREDTLEDASVDLDLGGDLLKENEVKRENATPDGDRKFDQRPESPEISFDQYQIEDEAGEEEEEEGEILDYECDDFESIEPEQTEHMPVISSPHDKATTPSTDGILPNCKIKNIHQIKEILWTADRNPSKFKMREARFSKPCQQKRSSSPSTSTPAPKKPSLSRSLSLNSPTTKAKSTRSYQLNRSSTSDMCSVSRKPALHPTPLPSDIVVTVHSVRQRLGPPPEESLQANPASETHEGNVYSELMHMFAPRSCRLCKIKVLTSEKTAAMHFNGKRHTLAVHEFLEARRVKIIKPEDVRYTGYRDLTEGSAHDSQDNMDLEALCATPGPPPAPISDARQVLEARRATNFEEDPVINYVTYEHERNESVTWERLPLQSECFEMWSRAKALSESPDLRWCQLCNNDYPPGLAKNVLEIGEQLQMDKIATPVKFATRMVYVFAYFRKLNLEPGDKGYDIVQKLESIFQVELPALIQKYKVQKAQLRAT